MEDLIRVVDRTTAALLGARQDENFAVGESCTRSISPSGPRYRSFWSGEEKYCPFTLGDRDDSAGLRQLNSERFGAVV